MNGGGRRRVAFVLPSLHGGGAERAAVHIVNSLDAQQWDRSMYLATRVGPYLNDVSPGVRIASGDEVSRHSQWLALRRFLAGERPDIVMAFLSYFTVLTAARAIAGRIRVVFNQQTPMSAFLEDADYAWRQPWRRQVFAGATRMGFNAADAVVATSQGVADDLEHAFGVRRDHVTIIPNPVDLQTVKRRAREPLDRPRQEQAPTIVAAGRLADAKNYPLLIDAMSLVLGRVPARLVILGQGEREAMLRGLVAERGLSDAIEFAGFQENPWKHIARAEVFVLTSRYEGFGNVLIEAMACGVPVVATASPGTRDIVRDQVDGLLVEEHTPAAVADALVRVLSDRAFRARLAEAAAAGAGRFALVEISARYDALFRRLVA
jgi:glycosyltransferase involved in cell wall biosynthesis